MGTKGIQWSGGSGKSEVQFQKRPLDGAPEATGKAGGSEEGLVWQVLKAWLGWEVFSDRARGLCPEDRDLGGIVFLSPQLVLLHGLFHSSGVLSGASEGILRELLFAGEDGAYH